MSSRHGKTRFLLLLTAIAAAGFLLRLIAGIQLSAADPAVCAPASVTDMATYKTLSEQILQGTFPKEFYYQPFYYAVFLPLIQLLTGPSDFMVLLAQSLCGGAAVLPERVGDCQELRFAGLPVLPAAPVEGVALGFRIDGAGAGDSGDARQPGNGNQPELLAGIGRDPDR